MDGIPDGYNILHAACLVGNARVVSLLLSHCVVGLGKEDDSVKGREENRKEVREEEKKDGEEKEVQETKNVGKVGIGVEGGKLDLNDVDLQGWMALHIAVLN